MFLDAVLNDAMRTFGGVFAGLVLFRVVELALPQRGVEPPQRHLFGAKVWLAYLCIQVALTAVLLNVMDSSGASPQVDPRDVLGLPTWAAGIVVAVSVLLVKDFFFYWQHRGEHRWLWRWHASHHSIRNLSASNSWHHWSEIIIFAIFVSLPLSLLSPAFGPRPYIVGLLLLWHPIYIHSSTRLQLHPWVRRVVIDSRFHRIHHSLEPRHFDRNFGSVTPLWDWLFGTMYMPRGDEWPEVGLAGIDEPESLRQWSAQPWRLKSGAPHEAEPVELTADPA